MICHPNAKINLGLNVTERRPDGYHNLETVFYPIPVCDALQVETDAGLPSAVFPEGCVPRVDEMQDYTLATTGIDIQCPPEKNLLIKALRALKQDFDLPHLYIYMYKQIPSGAGLGGGSADGAAVLLWLQRHAPQPLPEETMTALAARVGADVPFFLRGRPCLAEGIGEKLSEAESGVEGMSCVLVCPHVHVDTAWAYAAWDAEMMSFSLTEKTKADKNNRSSYQSFYGKNDFEPVVFAAHPELAALKMQLLREGADIAGMSGSGSALFGLFRNPERAAQAVRTLRERGEEAEVFGPFLL